MVQLGRFAVLLALAATGWSVLLAVTGIRTKRDEAIRSAEGGLRAAALSLTVAAVALWWAFLTRDFGVAYVAEYSSRSLSAFYTLGAFWAGQPGSLLLWAWLLALYGAIVVHQNRRRNRDLMPYVVAVLGASLFLFTFLVAFESDPFARLGFVPADGQGLNPMLQNYGQWFHPLTMYMGYVGFTVPFAFAIAALATGKLGDRWIVTVRKWTLWAWLLLGTGLLFGARWAYVELGWGGYWGWDPVENAGLMPWLFGTAYLHSVMIQEKRGMLKVWNVFLIVATFALSIFGTFLTRSGVIQSVHAFAESNIGGYLLVAVAATIVGGGVLIFWRLPDLRGTGRLDSVVSRESSFLLNNLLLVGIAFTVFWGTVFPLVAEAVRGVEVSVGPPFFDAVVTPMAVALLLLTGICPLLAWRKASLKNVRRNFVIPMSAGIAAMAVMLAILRGSRLGLAVVVSFSVFVAVTIGLEFARGARARRTSKHEPWPVAVTKLFAKNPRRYGGYLIHLGVVILLTGVALHVSFKQEARASGVNPGDEVRIGAFELTLRDLRREQTPAKDAMIATFSVADADSGERLGDLRAERAFYVNQDQPTTEVGIRSTPLADLYVILESADPAEGVASIAVLINPGVFWIWVGAIVMLIGGLVVGWPQRRQPPLVEEVTDATRRVLVPA
ncbi:MAG TPA: heme lyase CcmF/NrfE family subunit [Actinomycetota bacterium]|nr:heme lyase CcmF/NrfE family subunit [Actinomycetota bacterium]